MSWGIVGVRMLYGRGGSLGILDNGRIRALASHGVFLLVLPSYLHTFLCAFFVGIVAFLDCV